MLSSIIQNTHSLFECAFECMCKCQNDRINLTFVTI